VVVALVLVLAVTNRPASGGSLVGQSHVAASVLLGESSEHDNTNPTPNAAPTARVAIVGTSCFFIVITKSSFR